MKSIIDIFSEDDEIVQANGIDLDNLFEETYEEMIHESIKHVCGDDNEPTCSFEELHSADYDRFFVPLFADNKKVVFRENGIIVGHYLITTAHVAQEPMKEKCIINPTRIQTLFYQYEDDFFKITDEDIVYDGRGYDYESEDHDDLINYLLPDHTSPLILSNGQINEGDLMAVMPFRRNEQADNSIVTEKWVCMVTSIEVGDCNHDWKNCFKAYNIKSFFHTGNSGCALLRNDTVYGILIIANQDGNGPLGTFLDARYI